MEIYQCSPAD